MDKTVLPCYVKLTRLLESQIQCKTNKTQAVPHSSSKAKQNISIDLSKERNKFKCVVCPKSFNLRCNLDKHIFRHTNERPFKCSVCTKFFKSKEHLKSHQSVHSGERLFSCSKCPLKYSKSSDLKQHYRRVHLNDAAAKKTIKCPLCNKMFYSNSKLEIHRRIHSDVKDFVCVICEHPSRSLANLMSHIFIHTREKSFYCSECSATFSESYVLKSHSLRVHKKDEWNKYKCTLCTKAFHTVRDLNRHLKSQHSEKKQFICSFCNKKCKTEYWLQYHQRSHTKPFSCPLCQKRFGRPEQLSVHKLLHTGERPFSCSHCSVRFRSRHTLESHVREIHRNERPFSCDICRKSFSRPWVRDTHMATHFNEKPVKCEFCDRRLTKSGIRTHAKSHDVATDSQCVACSKRFLSELEMLQHYLKVHIGSHANLLECLFCNQVFRGKSMIWLELHMHMHTKERPYFCALCNMSFRQWPDLKSHEKARVHKRREQTSSRKKSAKL